MKPLLFASLLALSIAGTAIAQDQVASGGRPVRMSQIPPNKVGLNQTDSNALRNIAISNMFEIETSQLALRRGGSTWVRQYAKEMIHEHNQAQNEVKLLARRKGIRLPSSLPADKARVVRRLAAARGSSFDSSYRAIQIQAHTEAEAMLRKAMANGRDADVRGLEVTLLPSVVMHKRLAVMRRTMMGATQQRGNNA